MFLSHQRGDLVNLGYPRAWETRFASENLQSSVPRKSVIVEVFWGSPWALPEVLEGSSALLLGCCWLLLVSPAESLALLLFSWTLLLQFYLAPRSDFRDQKFDQI